MAQTVYGDLNVKRSIIADRRVNQGLSKETISGVRAVTINDYAWLQIINSSTQDVVLPDATTLSNGFTIVVMADAASGASVNVKTYNATTPVLLKNILVGRAYKFTLLDGTTAAGSWQKTLLGEADILPAERYVDTFNATTDWSGPAGGYYTRTITAVTHGMGTSPTVKVRSGSGPYVDVMTDSLSVAANGDITIQVTQTPDLRFAGQVLIG
jgi:hypothetical protein